MEISKTFHIYKELCFIFKMHEEVKLIAVTLRQKENLFREIFTIEFGPTAMCVLKHKVSTIHSRNQFFCIFKEIIHISLWNCT